MSKDKKDLILVSRKELQQLRASLNKLTKENNELKNINSRLEVSQLNVKLSGEYNEVTVVGHGIQSSVCSTC